MTQVHSGQNSLGNTSFGATGRHHDYVKCVCVCDWLLSCLNMPLLCVCHECDVCDTHCTLMTDTHKWYIYRTEQYCQAHTLSIDMTHTCDTSHTQCVSEVSQVGVMTMLSVCVCVWLAVVLSEWILVWIYGLCVCHECAVCHTHHTHDRHTSGIFRQDNSQPHIHLT